MLKLKWNMVILNFSFFFSFFVLTINTAYILGSDPKNFDIVIVNDQLEKAYEELKAFLTTFVKQIKQQ